LQTKVDQKKLAEDQNFRIGNLA